MKQLSVIIVSYNVKHYLEQCIDALLWAARDIDMEVIVVDNHSKDGTEELLKQRFAERITLILSNHNLGFAKANNIGIKASTGEYVLLLNPDTIVTERSIHHTLAFMQSHATAGALGVRMLKSDGTDALESRRGIPSPMTAFYKMTGLCSRFPTHPRFGHYYMSGISWTEPQEIEVISGAFCLLRRKALLEVGMLDTDYFMYGEDIELSYRLLKAGWHNWYYPSTILHYKGESTQKTSFRYVHVFYNAMLIFFRKNYGNMSFLVTLPIKVAIVAKALLATCKMVWRKTIDDLGLRSNRHRQQPFYVFIGSGYALKECRKIAHDKALDAEFHEGNAGTLPQGHLTLSLPSHRPLAIVYDTHAYDYKHIFNIFMTQPMADVTIGTYNTSTKKIITQSEVIYS